MPTSLVHAGLYFLFNHSKVAQKPNYLQSSYYDVPVNLEEVGHWQVTSSAQQARTTHHLGHDSAKARN